LRDSFQLQWQWWLTSVPALASSGGCFLDQEDASMTTDEIRAAACALTSLHQRFAPLFGRKEAQAQSLVYLNGLLLGHERKSAEPMALVFGEPDDQGIGQNQVLGLQRFLSQSPWDYQGVQREVQAVFAERLAPSAATWPIGIVGVFDSSSFPKKGTESVGVQRQYCGRLGKQENCQVGAFLIGVTPAGSALLEHQLYLPQVWADDQERRDKVHVPPDIRFQTELKIAVGLLDRVQAAGQVRFDWVTADETYGRNGSFLDDLEARGQRYVVEVPVNTTVWTVDPATDVPPRQEGKGRPPSRPRHEHLRSVTDVAASLPAEAWHAYQLREGACGPLVFEFAVVRVWAVRHRQPGPAIRLMMRRSLAAKPEIKYYVCHADADTPLETLALVSGCRVRVEEYFEDGKSHLGMAQYEARGWASWHHHMSLVAIAHLLVTLTRIQLKKQTPELTLDLALRILRSALARATLTKPDAMEIVAYHLHRNRVARKSHGKRWLKRHPKVRFKQLL
jgi:SRSO17 transposase